MKIKLSTSMAVILLSGIALISSNAVAGDSPQSSDPNVVALKTAQEGVRCYQDSKLNCRTDRTDTACALCDDELIITPPPPAGDDNDHNLPPSN